jgi:FAD/FMN-containing dehydrogenase
MTLLRDSAPLRVLDGFGSSVRAACRTAQPRNASELKAVLQEASAEGLSVVMRGAGRSYGDSALGARGLVVDNSAFAQILSFDKAAGLIEVEPGVTMEALWRRVLPEGFWPAVVPGTSFPSLGACAAMNIHGKNAFRVGPIGDHIRAFDLLLASGETLRCSREENADVFHAAIGGAGLLGVMTKLTLELKPVESGRLRVEAAWAPDFAALFAAFDQRRASADYLVGWIDGFASGSALGRGQLHAAWYAGHDSEPDPLGRATLALEHQELPARILGFPKSQVWRCLRVVNNPPGMRLLNIGKSLASRLTHGAKFLQSHAAFAFLLDSVPGWRRAYPRGLLQHQLFVPEPAARTVFPEVLRRCQARGPRCTPSLVVFKRHKPDPFLLSPSVDGWSLALDFAIPPDGFGPGSALRACADELTDLVLEAGGRFYLAKDQLLTPAQAERGFGPSLDAFFALKKRLDPGGLFQSDQSRRLFPGRV